MPYECPHCGYIAEAIGFTSCPGCGCPAREAYRTLSEGSAYKGLFTGITAEEPAAVTTRDGRGMTLHYLHIFDNELCTLAGRWYTAAEPGQQDRVDGAVSGFVSALADAGLHPYNPRETGLVLRKLWSAIAGALMENLCEPRCIDCTFFAGEGACEVDGRRDGTGGCRLFAGLVDAENLKLRLRLRLRGLPQTP
jgi:hypothetical protein